MWIKRVRINLIRVKIPRKSELLKSKEEPQHLLIPLKGDRNILCGLLELGARLNSSFLQKEKYLRNF